MADEIPIDSQRAGGHGDPAEAAASAKSEIWTPAGVDRDQQFNRAMAAAPRPLVTPILIAINTAVFAAMAASGFSFSHADAESFLRWGADFGPLTTHGQWWRIVTAVFVHASFVHLLMNMLILWSIGIFTERLFGRVAFSLLYLLAGVGGNLASLAWQPFTVSMGASGAIFGLYGGLMGLLLLHRNTVPRPRIFFIAKSAAILIAINLVYGLTQSNVDVAAHLGGLAAGFLLGCGLTGPLVPADPDWRQPRSLMVGLAAIAVAVVVALRMPVADDWRSNLNRLIPLDTNNQRLYSDALRKLQMRQMSPADFVKLIDRRILPPWNAERESLVKLRLSKDQRALADQLVEYMSLRSESWLFMEKGVAATDPAMARRSFEKQAAAEAALQALNRQMAPPGSPDSH